MSLAAFDAAGPPARGPADARALRDALEPLAACVYFAPEVHDAFTALGFTAPVGPDTAAGDAPDGLLMPDLAGYFCSRAGAMGQVSGPVVASVFGVFEPTLIAREVERGWATASLPDILAAREHGADAFLARALSGADHLAERERATELLDRAGDAGRLAGRPLYAGLRSLPVPATPWARVWRAADVVREHRGDAHVAAWTSAGLDAVEAGLLTEMFHGMPHRYYHRTRGWPEEELSDAMGRLGAAGLVTDEPALTDTGAALREEIEVVTDHAQAPLLAALDDDGAELLAILGGWASAIVAAGGFPSRITQIPARWGRPPA